MAPTDGEHRPDAPPPGRRARREAEQRTAETSSHPSPSVPGPAPAGRPSPYAAPATGPSPAERQDAAPARPSPYGSPAESPFPPSRSSSAPTTGSTAGPASAASPTTGDAATSRRAARNGEPATRASSRAASRPASRTTTSRGAASRTGSRPHGGRGGSGSTGRSPMIGLRQKMIGVGAVATIAFGGAIVVASNSNAETPMTRVSFSPPGTWAWYNDTSLGKTDELDQYAQATVSGLVDADHNAGFFLRYANKRDRVRVAVSGTVWRIEPAGGTAITGDFQHSPSGTFRAEVEGQTVRILWNGNLVSQTALPRSYSGHAVVATVWQSSPTVRMTNLEAASLTTRTGTTPAPHSTDPSTTSGTGSSTGTTPTPTSSSASPSPSTSASPSPSGSGSPSASVTPEASTTSRKPAGKTGWFSGASGDHMADGSFDRWRGTSAGIAGTWDDATPEGQLELYSICGGQYSSGRWNRKLDMAIGAIFKKQGESWDAAANGAYNDRWRKALSRAKECWGNRDPGDLYIRFAHELNLKDSDWGVSSGQEETFQRALVQFSNIRYQVFPGVNLVLSVNDGSSGGMADVRKLNPGRDSQGRRVVDVYGADSYNAWPHCTSVSACMEKFNATQDDGAPLGIEKHRQLAERWGVPFSVNEWSNNGDPGNSDGGGEAPAYMKAFHDWAQSHSGDMNNPKPGQMLYDCLFNLWKQYMLWPDTMMGDTASTYRQLDWGRA